jgi:hypothetical protein
MLSYSDDISLSPPGGARAETLRVWTRARELAIRYSTDAANELPLYTRNPTDYSAHHQSRQSLIV